MTMVVVRSTPSLCFLLLAIFVCGCTAKDQPSVVRPKQESFVDVYGRTHLWPGPDDCQAIVVVFVGFDCPISNSYAREIDRLFTEFEPKRVVLWVVYADADIRPEDALKHANSFGFRCPAILDPQMTLARKVGAKVKPEAAVLSPMGELRYLGRIDNRYVDFGKRREHVTVTDLRDALVAVLAGQSVAVPRTHAIGCDIDFPTQTQ